MSHVHPLIVPTFLRLTCSGRCWFYNVFFLIFSVQGRHKRDSPTLDLNNFEIGFGGF